MSQHLISPLADTFAPLRPAAGIGMITDQQVALIDSMLNPGAGWGQALLDGAEQVLAGASFGRERRHPLGGDPVETWSDAMAAKYRAAVIAVGD